MGGRFSHVHYREKDAALSAEFVLLSQVWCLDQIEHLSKRLRQTSFNFCLTQDQFADLLQLRHNDLFKPLLLKWFDGFKNTKTSTVINGLELLTAFAIASTDGKLLDKISMIFDIFDFDESGAITIDELSILLKSCIRGLSKITVGLGPRLISTCPTAEIGEIARQCFRYCDIEEEQELRKELFIEWTKHTPKIANLIRCFVQKEFVSDEEAASSIQRCIRGMYGRKKASEKRLEKQIELEAELNKATQKIQIEVVSHKKKRDKLRELKIERFAQHGALYSFGSNTRGHLGHAHLELTNHLNAPMLSQYFKNNELRVVNLSISPVHACAVTSNGQIFTWGTGVPGSFGFIWHPTPTTQHSQDHDLAAGIVRKSPTHVEDLDDIIIVDASLGNRHSVALSDKGNLYTWGSAEYGQLGHGNFMEDSNDIFKRQFDHHTGRDYHFVDLPLQLDKSYFEEMKVLEVACGYYFTVALCEDGSVFTWGEGSDGQLGLGYNEDFKVGFLDEHIHGSSFVYMHTPTRVNELSEPIGSIAVGGNHVYAITPDHCRVYEWGAWNRRCGQTKESLFSPTLAEDLSKLYVDKIACGKEHTLAITGNVEFSIGDAGELSCSALTALFGPQPVHLAKEINGSLFVPNCGASSRMLGSVSQQILHEHSDGNIRTSLSGCMGKFVYLDRGTSTGHWITLLKSDTAAAAHLEIPCVLATVGPSLTEQGLEAKLFYSPQKLKSLRLYVRPDEVVGKIVVLEFDQQDLSIFNSDRLDLSEIITMIMVALIERVKDAQESGAAAAIIIFDLLDAEPFSLESCVDDTYNYLIPVVMIKKKHGDLLLEYIKATTSQKKPAATLSYKKDILSKQILTAQKLGAKGIIVGQTRIDDKAVRLRPKIFEDGNTAGTENHGVKIPIVMVSYDAAQAIKEEFYKINGGEVMGTLGLRGFGNLYAWGYAANGRLGMGDIENEEIFKTGYDAARQVKYQYVPSPEYVSAMFQREISSIACGEDHSAAITSDGELYTWGSGKFGKLGHGNDEDHDMPQLVKNLNVRVAKAVCGPNQTLVISSNPSLQSTQRGNMPPKKYVG